MCPGGIGVMGPGVVKSRRRGPGVVGPGVVSPGVVSQGIQNQINNFT